MREQHADYPLCATFAPDEPRCEEEWYLRGQLEDRFRQLGGIGGNAVADPSVLEIRARLEELAVERVSFPFRVLERSADDATQHLLSTQPKFVHPLLSQISAIMQMFPHLSPDLAIDFARDRVGMPTGFGADEEGVNWFASVNPHRLSRTSGGSYNAGFYRVLDQFHHTYERGRFTNMRRGALDSSRLCLSPRTREMMITLAKMQRHSDILVFPARLYANEGVTCAAAERALPSNQFLLDATQVGSILLTHRHSFRAVERAKLSSIDGKLMTYDVVKGFSCGGNLYTYRCEETGHLQEPNGSPFFEGTDPHGNAALFGVYLRSATVDGFTERHVPVAALPGSML